MTKLGENFLKVCVPLSTLFSDTQTFQQKSSKFDFSIHKVNIQIITNFTHPWLHSNRHTLTYNEQMMMVFPVQRVYFSLLLLIARVSEKEKWKLP